MIERRGREGADDDGGGGAHFMALKRCGVIFSIVSGGQGRRVLPGFHPFLPSRI